MQSGKIKRMWDNVPASLALPEEAFGSIDRGVSGIHCPVEEEGLLGLSLTVNELKTFLER